MVHSLGEYDVEFDYEVTTGAITLHLKLRGRVSNDVSNECSGHALACNSQLGLRGDHVCRRHKHFPIIECVHCDWLHLQGFHQAKRVSVDKVVTFAHEVGQRLLGELDDKV